MKTPILLGIIAITILGTMAVQGMMVQAGMSAIETIQVTGTSSSSSSSATCPPSHPFLIGGSYSQQVDLFSSIDRIPYSITPEFDVLTNTYRVFLTFESFSSSISVQAFALCANFNFPMGVIGGDWVGVNNVSLLLALGSINAPWIALGIVGISAGIWYYKEKKKVLNS